MEHLAQRKMTMRRKTAVALDLVFLAVSSGFLAWLTFIALTGDVQWNAGSDYPSAVEAIDPTATAKSVPGDLPAEAAIPEQ